MYALARPDASDKVPVLQNCVGWAQMIPHYQSLMLPLLQIAADGQEHRIRDVIDPLTKKLGLSQADVEEMLPSGRQPIFNNRVHWAKTYLAQAKLLEITRRAHICITPRGHDVLAEAP